MSEQQNVTTWEYIKQLCSKLEGVKVEVFSEDTFRISFLVGAKMKNVTNEYIFLKTLEECDAFLCGYKAGKTM